MKTRKIEFGKVSSPWCSRKNNMVEIEIEIKPQRFWNPQTKESYDGEDEITISGNLWNAQHTDCNECGQCLDSLQEMMEESSVPVTSLWKTIYDYWKNYHGVPRSKVPGIEWMRMIHIIETGNDL